MWRQKYSTVLPVPKSQWRVNYSFMDIVKTVYSVLVSVSCPKALFHLESDNLFCITVVVADWLG